MKVSKWGGRTALVTGASRGLGRVIAEGLASEGLHLVLVARDADKLAATQEACAKRGVRAEVRAVDLLDPEARAELVASAGEIDVLVNNAGIEIALGLVDQTEQMVANQIELNLRVPIELTRAFLPALESRPYAAVVNISSMSGKTATPYNAIYAATKHGLNGFTSSLRVELHGSPVTCGVVCPSFVAETGMWANTGVKAPALMREVRPERLVDAVLKVMNGKPEVLVTPSPVRPLLALNALFPALDGPMLRLIGVVPALQARARRVAQLEAP